VLHSSFSPDLEGFGLSSSEQDIQRRKDGIITGILIGATAVLSWIVRVVDPPEDTTFFYIYLITTSILWVGLIIASLVFTVKFLSKISRGSQVLAVIFDVGVGLVGICWFRF
jgi:FtsH-binding integral membrane protein